MCSDAHGRELQSLRSGGVVDQPNVPTRGEHGPQGNKGILVSVCNRFY